MTVDEFLAWGVRQQKGRYELFDGRVVRQQPQSWGHAHLCVRMYSLLAEAVERTGVPFFAAPMGMTVRITDADAFEPDTLVAPLPKPLPTDLEIPNPVLVVEVLSPSSVKRDLTDKVAGYSRVPGIEHYLVLNPEEREVIWYRRAAGAGLQPPVTVDEGALELDPPGIVLAVAEIFPPE
jgi:Uma2 family endonuclease